MKIASRLSFIFIAILFGYNSVYSQTQADVKMGEILNSGDLFVSLRRNAYCSRD